MSEPPNDDGSWGPQYPAHPPHVDEPQHQQGGGNAGLGVLSGCLSAFGFVILAFVLGAGLLAGPDNTGRIVVAVLLGAIALLGVPMLFVRGWIVRGIGIGLLLGWGIATVISGGVCTGLNSMT